MAVIYISRKVLAFCLLITTISILTLGLFHQDIQRTALEVMAVINGAKMHPIYAVDTGEKLVALSFDAAWGSTRTRPILEILDRHGIKTTFFLTNIWLKQYPDMAKEIAQAGHEIGMHSVTHPRLTDISDEQIRTELYDNAKMISDITGQKPYLFRPPFGAYNNRVIKIIQECGFVPIQWSVDSLDWKNLTGEQITERVTKRVHPGAIILFHNDGAYTPQALEPVLEYLKKEGYTAVPVSQLIYKDNYYIDVNGIQKLKQQPKE